ncbi:leucine-rich repeat-containing protein 45-like [Physella acuta]|uniref:leucine-rich repeat-containing protein 45-like n=1 Tax=Physella acuta TaxID=109671 RepID=UPI0027DE7582|nr:leucine-rich repeat-containing protein 45-like [Physella acuta]XP_059173714.1 leucine-rich repeat-containing protein 45-like [Physella acuta]XP_059173715.1 leucine-rich repeat-containing protein 45-like [Physella acuta]
MMQDFRHTYIRLCKDHHIDPQDCVLEKLKSLAVGSSSKAVLDLSTNSLTPKTCAVLGKVLASDRTFVEIKFSDCMLAEDAIKGLSQGLTHNTFCRKLDLKGNNIRGTATEALGKMLCHNKSLVSLCLEWNAMGMLDNSFAVFCEGVGSNTSLRALDLRNNQISHDSVAELAASLKRNVHLKALDLRWNNCGLLGGRALLEMLQSNKTLSRLELAGNNIPSDILKSIETAVQNNADRQIIVDENLKRTQTMAKHIRGLEQDKKLQLNELLTTIDQQEEVIRKSQRLSTHQIGNLQVALDERKSAFNSLAAKLSMAETELALSEQKVNDFNSTVNRLKSEMQEMAVSHMNELRKEKEDRANEELKYLKEISDAQDKNIQLQNKVEDLERKCRQQQEQIYDLKEQLTHVQSELTLKGSQFEERITQEKLRQKEAMRDLEQYKQKDMARMKQESEEMERILRDRISKMESQRLDMEEEISRLKSANVSDKLNAEEQIASLKHRLKSEEEQRHVQLEEKIRVLQTSRDELHSHCNQQTSTISQLQHKNSNLQLELENMRRQMNEVNEELSQKNNYTMAEVGKVKAEMSKYQSKLDQERSIQSELREKLASVDTQMSEQLLKHRKQVEEKDKEIVMLEEKLKGRELELVRLREEEAQRVQALQSAIFNYVGSKQGTATR